MKNDNEIKGERLEKNITIRFSGDDYLTLLNISKTRCSDVSKDIRTMTKPILALTKENNCKIK